MSPKITMFGPDLPNLPWEGRPSGSQATLWRFSRNPIIPGDLLPASNSIFNSAVVPFKGEFAGVFRVDNTAREMRIHAGLSVDGIAWHIDPDPIVFTPTEPGIPPSEYYYDPRVVWIEDRYYVMWCNGYHGPTIGLGYTHDFKSFFQMDNAFLPYNRNGVLFPRKIGGRFAMLSRPSDRGHTPFGDMFYSESPDLTYWGRHRFVMTTAGGWQSTKVGAGPAPIETQEGWLLFYHGVLTSCNGFEYAFGAALLDLDQPWKVMYRTRPYLLAPKELYERVGDTANVCFPCAALTDPATGRIAIYYGGADTVVALAFCYVDEVVKFVRENSM